MNIQEIVWVVVDWTIQGSIAGTGKVFSLPQDVWTGSGSDPVSCSLGTRPFVSGGKAA